MATGDLKNNLRKLQFQLRAIKYDQDVDFESLGRGIPSTFLPLYHYAFIEYSHLLAKRILEMHLEMYSKTDLRFIETMYKVLRELFSYKPIITKEQFFSPGFGERKVIMCCDILQLIRNMHKMMVGFKPAQVAIANSSASASRNELILPKRTHVTQHPSGNESIVQECTLVPIVINEMVSPTLTDSKLSVNEISEEKLQEQMNIKSAISDSNYDKIHKEEFENPSAFDILFHNKLMTLNEARLNDHQAIINDICEKLSYISSKITMFEDRLNKVNVSLAHLTSNSDSLILASSSASESCHLKQSLENLVARLTLVENRVSLLENQGKPFVPVLENISLKKSENMNKDSKETKKPFCVSRANISNSISVPSMFNCQTDSNVGWPTESDNSSSVLQAIHIEAMLKETDELLINSQHSTTKVLCSEEINDNL